MQQTGRTERLWERAERHLATRNLEAARAGFEAVLAADPRNVGAWLRLSTLATAQGRYRASVHCLLSAAALATPDGELQVMLAGMLHRLGEVEAALACLRHPSVRGGRAIALKAAQLASQMEQAALARELLDHVERIGGTDPSSLYTGATVALFEGDLGGAQQRLVACLAQAPGHAQAWWSLSRLRRQRPEANHVDALRGLLARGPDPASAASLGFALFKELDDLDRTDEAWEALSAASRTKRGQLDWNPQADAAAFDTLHRLPVDQAVEAAQAGPQPIFIVGLPRTGTTLLERVLGGSSEVTNAGELDELPLQLRWCADRFSRSFLDASVFGQAARLDPAGLGERYLRHAAWRAQGRASFTDKLPLNFLHVGFIARALPGARILHMTREPMDACFANLKELFAEAYPYSYDLDELATHYGQYRRLMAHWHACFPGRILDVAYEDLVGDPEAASRRVYAHCGLEWRPEVVRIEEGRGTVSTASTVQVREPIHRRSVQGWRRYATALAPLEARLRADGWLS
jgi:tetratricopeptide (TPR) repeat protein